MPDDMTHRRALRVKAPATLPTPTGADVDARNRQPAKKPLY